jgi:hypothetical protein
MFAGRAIGKADTLLTIPGIAIVVVTGLPGGGARRRSVTHDRQRFLHVMKRTVEI